ncbi:MAG: NAD-glutamate dehydrogenase, partial [Proteobacteria bacterium]|nr:NAD-glutamate dehydrogenase [Pseudomonadota bacterium]
MTRRENYLKAFMPANPLEPNRDSFMNLFATNIADADLADRNPAADALIAGDLWNVFESWNSALPLIQVVNPENDERFTIVRLLHPDMPFITDSVLMELSRHQLVLHFLHNIAMTVERDSDHLISTFPESAHLSDLQVREVLIYAEIDRVSGAEIGLIQKRLSDALADVRAAVADHGSMLEQVRKLINELAKQAGAEAQQTIEFLEWLLDDHFTFLGYREFAFDDSVKQITGSELGTLKNRRPASKRAFADMRESARNFLQSKTLLSFSKGGTRSMVHRPAYPDYVGVKRIDASGNVVGECGFLGLYTSPVYRAEPDAIPVLRGKVRNVLASSGLDLASFDGKALRQVLATYPRDELLQTPQTELTATALAIAHIHERRQTKLFLRIDQYGLFVNALVYMPRELYTTWVRQQIEQLLVEATGALGIEFDTYFSESILVRVQLTLRVDPTQILSLDERALEATIVRISRDWEVEFGRALRVLPQNARSSLGVYSGTFSTAYRSVFDVATALEDARKLASLSDHDSLTTQLYRPDDFTGNRVRLKVFHHGRNLPLSTILPILENLGFEVIGEHPFEIPLTMGVQSIQDFELRYPQELDIEAAGGIFEDALVAVWRGRCENDSLNRLVLAAALTWNEVGLLRAYSRYLKQIRFGLSQRFIADTLLTHQTMTRRLVEFFCQRFDPALNTDTVSVQQAISQGLNDVTAFNEDKVLRALFRTIHATVRTNYFQTEGADKGAKSVLALKIASRQLPDLPKPAPEFEVFVYGVAIEGVHLRSSKVARGGIRWSDRLEDYRTEVLALMKTQVVKNAVIVPSGAKGGFVVRRDMSAWEPSAQQAEVNRVYKLFITALLEITDNVTGAVISPPAGVRAHDNPDPYLVVAADKGTATFSDDANTLAAAHGYWLGDAFASGGSNGYDHKKMGITAKGAWVSVMRHFRELGVNAEADPISIIGIGDMAGDVFGNGLLRTRSALLVGAFNHRHIFLDPQPDPVVSFAERQRLFSLPRSGWQDYATTLLSRGGGVYLRTQKTISVSSEVAERFAIEPGEMSPDQLIRAMLRAPVDLIWNGGIGTYVKAKSETNEAASDPINDDLRVDACDIRARVIGEGGNLGFTALARVEYALNHGSINTDFIDNAGGVDCSDHEVNIKILLDNAIAQGELAPAERNQVLAAATADVELAVLDNNNKQAQALSLACRQAAHHPEAFGRFIRHLERVGLLNRRDDGIATDEDLAERTLRNQTLTRPELAVLMSYAKIELKAQLSGTTLQNVPAYARFMRNTFPGDLHTRFHRASISHQLASEITCTRVANEIIDYLGMTFVHGIMETIGCKAADVVNAYVVAGEVLRLPERREEVEASATNSAMQIGLLQELASLGHRVTRWLLRRHRNVDAVELITR